MKVLQINNGKAEYLTKDGNYSTIIDINKEDIYYIINIILDNDVEIDIENNTDNIIVHDVEKTIYTNIRLELEKVIENKIILNSSVDDLFKDAYIAYKEDIREKLIASEMSTISNTKDNEEEKVINDR